MSKEYRSALSAVSVEVHDRQKDFPDDVWDDLLTQMTERLPEHATVVDAGVGSGVVADRLALRGTSVIGFDFNSSMLGALVKRTDGSVPCALADVRALPLSDLVADAVVITNVLHLMQDWRSAVAEAARVLVPGGVLFVGLGSGGRSEIEREVTAKFRNLVPTGGADGFGPSSDSELLESLREWGLVPADPITASGVVTRDVRSVVERLQHNIFTWPPGTGRSALNDAAERTSEWAAAQYGSLDLTFEVAVEFRLLVGMKT